MSLSLELGSLLWYCDLVVEREILATTREWYLDKVPSILWHERDDITSHDQRI